MIDFRELPEMVREMVDDLAEPGNEERIEADVRLTKLILSQVCPELQSPKIRWIGGGSCNENYLAQDERQDGSSVVVKLSKPYREYKALHEYQKEKWCTEQVRPMGVRVPDVLRVGQCESRAFMLQSYIDGRLPTSAESPDVWKTFGEYARKIESVATSGHGEDLRDDSGNFGGDWPGFVRYNIAALDEADPLLAMGLLTKQRSVEVRALFESLLQRPFRFGLCHGDIALWNAWIAGGGITYLLDWGCARSEIVPHYQINEILRASKPSPQDFAAYLDSYGIRKTDYQKMREELHILSLLREIDTLRWAIERMPDQVPSQSAKLAEALEGRNLIEPA